MFFTRGLLLQYENFQKKLLGPIIRNLGQNLYRYGARVQNEFFHEDRRNYLLTI